MSILQFLLAQIIFLLFFLSLSSIFVWLPQFYSYYLLNFMQFFLGSWILSLYLKQHNPYTDVLSVTLSFNLVTYLVSYFLLGAALPHWFEVLKDFLLVILFSLAGAYFGKKR